MCMTPIKIPNTNRGHGRSGLMFMKDTTSQYIEVPCGHCPQCIAARQNSVVQRAEVESETHHLYFATLTYDNQHLPHATLQVPPTDSARKLISKHAPTLFCVDAPDEEFEDYPEPGSNGDIDIASAWFENEDNPFGFDDPTPLYKGLPTDPDTGEVFEKDKFDWINIDMPYADIHDIQLLLKNLRDNLPKIPAFGDRDLKYIAVSELGKANGRPHFHILFFVEKRPGETNADGTTNKSACIHLEQILWKAVYKYWAVNIGTRKNPVYEHLFTYKKRYFGRQVHTNYDLHWVDPSTSKDGMRGVAYYVTKYMLKGSDRERRRQQFLRLNLVPEDYLVFWNTVKCRCTMSKGLGLDARFETIEKRVPYERKPLLQAYAEYLDTTDDLPMDFEHFKLEWFTVNSITEKRRIMVPNFEVVYRLRLNCTRDIGDAPGPVYIGHDGKHVPLSHYYQRFGYLYTPMDAMSIWFAWDPAKEAGPMDKKEYDKRMKKFERQKQMVVCNSSFDTSTALLWDTDSDSNQPHLTLL